MSERRTIDQERAQSAWEAVRKVSQQKQEIRDKYRSLVRGFAADVMTHGLGQALAFLRAKSGGSRKKGKDANAAHDMLYWHISKWVTKQMRWKNYTDEKNGGLLHAIIAEECTSADYRRATTETLAYVEWLKRFAEAELEKPEPN